MYSSSSTITERGHSNSNKAKLQQSNHGSSNDSDDTQVVSNKHRHRKSKTSTTMRMTKSSTNLSAGASQLLPPPQLLGRGKVMIIFVSGIVLLTLFRAWAEPAASSSLSLMEAPRKAHVCDSVTMPQWLQDLRDFSHERSIFSQYGEDGMTEYLISNVAVDSKFYVEFGTEDGSECNTRVLRERHGWKGLLMDGSNANEEINLYTEMINADNIVSLLRKYDVHPTTDIGYFSEDTDFADYYIWKSILEAGYRPRILVSEVNNNFEPIESGTVHRPAEGETRFWGRNNYFGVSPLALKRLYVVPCLAIPAFFSFSPSLVW
jgi:hypothetical protein